jgi:hypothetical protein
MRIVELEMQRQLLTGMVVLTALLAVCPAASAQRSAGSKIMGTAYEYPYFYRSAGAYQDTAYQHADVLRESVSYGEPIPAEVATEHTAAIRSSIAAANKKYAALRKLAGNHKEANAQLDAIDAHHKAALSHVDKIDKAVASGKGDPAAVGEAAHAAASSLKSAQAEHEKLMQHFAKPTPK